MADAIIPQTEPAAASQSVVLGLYHVAPSASKTDIINQLQARLAQLSAMLCTTYGGGFETFDNWSEDVKDNYLWGCATMADECRELCQRL